MFKKLAEQLKANARTIVFTEGTDARILEAADKLTTEGILGVILLGKADEVKSAAKEAGFNIEKCQIIDPEQYAEIDAMVDEMVTLRKGKMTPEQVREALSKSNYFGTMLVKMGKADCLLGGATYSTADTVRPALQLIKTKPGNKIVSSCFIMVKGDKKLAMGDCAINIKPTAEELETFEEAGACGTAAVISPIQRIDDLENGKSYVISKDGKPGPICTKLYNKLRGIQYGDEPDTHGWVTIVE